MAMTFQQAYDRLKVQNPGKYVSATYGLMHFGHSGVLDEAKCVIYVEGDNFFHHGKTWELAFEAQIKNVLTVPPEPPDPVQAPDGEVGDE